MAYSPYDDPTLEDRLNSNEQAPQMPQVPQEPGRIRRGYENTKNRVYDEAQSQIGKAANKGIRSAIKGGTNAGARSAAGAGGEALAGTGAAGAGAAGTGAATAAGGAGAAGAAGVGAAGTGAAIGAEAGVAAGVAAGAAGAGAGAAAGAGVGTGTAAAGASAGAALGGAAGTVAPVAGNIAGAAAGAAVGTAAGIATGGATTFAVKHPKGVAMTLVISIMTLVIILFGGIFILSPFKKDIATQQTAQKVMAPINTIVELRTQYVLANYIVAGSQPSIDAGLPQAAGKAGQLYQAMREMGFDQAIEKYELTLAPGNQGGTVRIVSRGIGLGDARTTSEAFILLNKSSATASVIQNLMHSWDWAQHTKIAQPAKALYKNPQLNIPGADEANSDKALTEVAKYQVSTATQPTLNNIGSAMGCMLGSGVCNEENTQPGITATSQLQDQENGSLVKASQAAYEANLESITPENNYEAPTLRNRSLANLNAQLKEESLPLFSWLDVGTVADYGSTDPAYEELPVDMRSQQAGSLFLMSWIGTSQSTAEKVNFRSANLMNKGFAQMEESQAYSYIAYEDTSRGQPLADYQKVNSMSDNPMETFKTSWFEENKDKEGSFGLFSYWNALRELPIFGNLISTMISTILTHPLINVAGTVIDNSPLFTLLRAVNLGPLTDIANMIHDQPLSQVIATSFGLSSDLIISECDPSLRTYNYFNCVVMGAQDLYVKTCEQNFGCGNLSQAEIQELQAYRTERNKQNLATLPWHERLFDVKTPNSMLNLAVLKSPMPVDSTQNIASFYKGVSRMVGSIPDNLATIFAGKALAANNDPNSIGGIENNKGIPLNVLKNAPFSQALTSDSGTCDAKIEGVVDICWADTAVIDSLSTKFITYKKI